jgi:putative ABC transport system permease protein
MGALGSLLSDLRFAARALLQRPGYTAVAVTTLALGIGANAAIFSVANTVLLKPLPYSESDRLVRILADNQEIGVEGAGLALGDFQDFRSRSRSLQGLAVYTARSFDLTGGSTPEVIRGVQGTADLFSVLMAGPALGRTFLPEEESPGRGKVVVLSDAFWQRRFGGSRSVLGQTLELDGERHQIVGVMPAEFRFPRSETDIWVPLEVAPSGLDRMSHYLGAVGRLAQGATTAQADAEIRRLAGTLASENPDTNQGWSARVVRLSEHMTGPVRPALLVLSGAVALLLLIAGANVANLLLARGMARQKETAIRAALGAPRSHLIRLFLVESTLLALVGGGLGLLLTLWGVDALVAAGPADLPRLEEIGVDHTVFLFALVLALVCGLVSGAFPALQLSRTDLNRFTKEGHGTGGRSSSRFRSSLVVAEVALALVLLVGAALMLQGFQRLSRIDPGFDPGETLVVRISLSPTRYPEVPAQVQFFERLLADLETIPEVVSAAAASAVPLDPLGQNLLPFEPLGIERPEGTEGTFAVFTSVTPGYFKTLRIPLLAGRDFLRQDDAEAPPVLIVNQILASRYWPNENVIGKRLRATISGTEPVSYEIVGVVGASREQDLAQNPEPAIYAPYRQVPPRGLAVVLRTEGDPLRLAEPVHSRVLALDPDQPISRTTTLEQVIEKSGARTRFYTALFGLFAAVGLTLAAIGIYGVIAYSVSNRTQEMAVRMALGARAEHIFRLVVGGGLRLALVGVALGLVGALLVTRLLGSLLYGISASDPLTFALVPLLLLLVALFASWLPARRALRIDPMLTIRRG